MADKSSKLADILKQEYQSKGIVGGLASATGKRALEKLDIRNALFGGSGVGSLVGRKIFGKGYSAIGDKQTAADKITSQTAPIISAQTNILDAVATNTQISAKNSMTLPSMARDMNVMRQNIIKLVKLQGGTATNKADMFFTSAKDREGSYETQFKKATKTSPTKTENVKKDDSSSSGGILGFLSGILGAVGDKFLPIIASAAALGVALFGLKETVKGIYNWFATSSIGKSMGLTPTEDYKVEKNGYSTTTNNIVNTAAGVGGAIAGVSAIAGASKLVTASKAGAEAVLDARTTSVGSLANSKPNTTWGKFLKWLARRSPTIIQKFGLKLAQATALASIPVAGWVMAAVQLGFSLWTAYEIYELWKEFNKEEEQSPTQINEQASIRKLENASESPSSAPSVMAANGVPTLAQIGNAESGKLGYDAANKGKAGDMPNGMPGLSNKKVGEIMKLQSEKQLFAAGKYQIIPQTLNSLVREGIVSMNDTFDKATQDKLGQALYDKRIKVAGDDPIKQQYELSKEWAAIANPYTGASYYAGVGNNKASIMGNTAAGGTALASNSQSFEEMIRSAMAGAANITNNNVVNNNGGGQQGATVQVAMADVVDYELGKLMTRMY
jgi:hypothetical protein